MEDKYTSWIGSAAPGGGYCQLNKNASASYTAPFQELFGGRGPRVPQTTWDKAIHFNFSLGLYNKA